MKLEAPAIMVSDGKPEEVFPDVPGPAKFDEAESDYLEAPALARVGEALIAKRAGLEYLRDYEIAYLWQKKGGSSRGKPVLGRCRRPRGLLAQYCGADFIVSVSADYTAAAQLTRFQIEALVYHELCHASVTENGARLVPHDYEGFNSEVSFHGAWRPDLEKAAATFQQLRLL
jgi:Putative phage metallopeptidase